MIILSLEYLTRISSSCFASKQNALVNWLEKLDVIEVSPSISLLVFWWIFIHHCNQCSEGANSVFICDLVCMPEAPPVANFGSFTCSGVLNLGW